MRFLLETSKLRKIALAQDPNRYDSMSYKQKETFLKNYFKEMENYSNIKDATRYIEYSIDTDGLDTKKNDYLGYMLRVKDLGVTITSEMARILYNVWVDNDIDFSDSWLYNKSLYTESEEDIVFKIKAMIYASSPSLRRGASKSFNENQFINKDGTIQTAKEIEQYLRSVTVSDKVNTIKYLFYSDIKNVKSTIEKLDYVPGKFKKEFTEFVESNFENTTYATSVEKLYDEWDYYKNHPNEKAPYTNKPLKPKTTSTRKNTKAAEKAAKEAAKGYNILKSVLKTKDLELDKVREYVAGMFSANSPIVNTIKFGGLDNTLETVLNKEYTSVIGRDPVDMLNSSLYDEMYAAYQKNFRPTGSR